MPIKNDFMQQYFGILISLELILQDFFEIFREEITEVFRQISLMLFFKKNSSFIYMEMISQLQMAQQYVIISMWLISLKVT